MMSTNAGSRGRQVYAIAVVLGLCSVLTGKADGQDSKNDCIHAHEQGQLEHKARKLRTAAELFIRCSQELCPGIVREECGKWLSEVRGATPSVVLAARGGNGEDTAEVQVFVDGALLTQRLDGRSIDMDPGEHTFRFVGQGGQQIEQKHILNEGETRRRITVDFSSLRTPKAGAVTVGTSRSQITPFVLGGIGLAALGSFGYFALSGRSKENELKSDCAPHCSDDAVSVMDKRYLVADISLGVGLISLGVAGWMFWKGSASDRPVTQARIDVRPLPGGTGISFSSGF